MMATLQRTFRAYFTDTPNPYANRGDLGQAFQPDPGVQPGALLATADSLTYPLPLLLAGRDGKPIITIAPFADPQLPGLQVGAN